MSVDEIDSNYGNNAEGQSKKSSSSLELGEAEIRIVRFTISLSTPITILPLHPTGLVSVPENTALKIFCLADGHPIPEVKWKKDYRILQDSEIFDQRINITSNGKGSSTLRFSEIQYDDAASYSCQASNTHGQVQKSIKINVTKILTVQTTTPSLCEQIPKYCVHGHCASGIDPQNSFMCLCSPNYEGARCDKFILPNDRLKVNFPDQGYTTISPCKYGCHFTTGHLLIYSAFGILFLILAIFLAIFLLQKRRRGDLIRNGNMEISLSSLKEEHERKSIRHWKMKKFDKKKPKNEKSIKLMSNINQQTPVYLDCDYCRTSFPYGLSWTFPNSENATRTPSMFVNDGDYVQRDEGFCGNLNGTYLHNLHTDQEMPYGPTNGNNYHMCVYLDSPIQTCGNTIEQRRFIHSDLRNVAQFEVNMSSQA